MKDQVTVAALQARFFDDSVSNNVETVSRLVREAAASGAQIILPPELFEGPYFCTLERDEEFNRARPLANHPTVAHFSRLAAELSVVIPVSYFEQDGPAYYNSLVVIDADGTVMENYRKSHIPDGPGYEEKFYFRGGDTGFKVWKTRYATIGVGICWDQWFPEAARVMTMMGAEVLFYPTAIGTEPEEPGLDTMRPWQRAMQGHAVSNIIPVVAANRVGAESRQSFYGHSFITDHLGALVAELDGEESGYALYTIDRDLVRAKRNSFGFFRDRRPELYGLLQQAGPNSPR